MATYVVGDIQGCFQSLKALLTACQFRAGVDRLICAGDLIARGPDSLSVLQWVLDHHDTVAAVLGNHDLHFLSVASGLKPSKPKDKTDAILEASDLDAIVDWYRHCPLTIDLPEYNALVVHAGVWPGWDRHQWLQAVEPVQTRLQSETWITHLSSMYGDTPAHPKHATSADEHARFVINASTRMRFVEPHDFGLELTHKEAPADAPASLVAWMDAANRVPIDRQIVFGHWATLNGARRTSTVYALDTGCVYGGALSALRLEDHVLIQVSCADVD